VLEAGSSVPDVMVSGSPREEAVPLREVLGAGLTLLCFYLYDCSQSGQKGAKLSRCILPRR
jgi:hypothetical protein